MAKRLYDLAVKTREYMNSQGEKKAAWQNVGSVMEADDGSKFIMLSRWFNPAGVPDLSGKGCDAVLLSMFQPKDQSQQRAQSEHSKAKSNGYQQDDTPF